MNVFVNFIDIDIELTKTAGYLKLSMFGDFVMVGEATILHVQHDQLAGLHGGHLEHVRGE